MHSCPVVAIAVSGMLFPPGSNDSLNLVGKGCQSLLATVNNTRALLLVRTLSVIDIYKILATAIK